MIFKPDPDYAGLLKQAQAMHQLIKAQSAELSTLRTRNYSLREQRLAELESQVSSERDANALLAEELNGLASAYEAHLEMLRQQDMGTLKDLIDAYEQLRNENAELQARTQRFIEMF